MSNTIIKSIMPLLSVGMMVIFAIFLVVGILFGLARGAKRSGLHFIIFVGLLFFSFVLTPYIMKSVLGINIFIAGQTPKQFVDDLSNRFMSFLQEQVGDYIVPFQKYIKGYALGVVLAVLNMAVFFALYFVVKIVSWIIYSITAHFVAPKRDRNGNKLPKHAALGGLIGGIQGLCLFVIFMFPFNGIISVVNNAAIYQNMQTQNEQAVNPPSLNEEILSEENELDLENLLNQVDAPLRVYNSFMKYSGLQFLSNKAFEYQLTIRVDDGEDINLLHDINSGFELYIDSKEFMRVVNKLQKVYDNGKLDLSSLTESDYQVLRQFINKAFDLEILNVVDDLLSDMNSIFNTPFNDDLTKIAGTEIYTNSIYGKMIVHNTAHAENYQEYASGLQAMVNYVADQKLNLVRSDLINMIDFVETFNIYQISYEGLEQSKTLTDILAKNKLGVKDYFDLSTARIVNNYGQYIQGTPLLNVLGDRLLQFTTVKMIGVTDIENLLLYSKFMDNAFTNDADTKTLVNELIPLFMGEKALTHDGVQGNWEKLGNDLLGVAHVLRNYVTIIDDINSIKDDLISNGSTESQAQVQALLEYLSGLVISKDEYEANKTTKYNGLDYDHVRFQKVDDLVDALYQIFEDFQPVKTFVKNKLATMKTGDEGDYIQKLIDMFDQEKKVWSDTLHGIVNVADIINNSPLGDLIDKVQNITTETADEIAKEFIDTITQMDTDDVVNMVTNIMDIPAVSDVVEQSLNEILTKINETPKDDLKVMLGRDDIDAVLAQVGEVQHILEETDKEEIKTKLPQAVGDLWDLVKQYTDSDLTKVGVGN